MILTENQPGRPKALRSTQPTIGTANAPRFSTAVHIRLDLAGDFHRDIRGASLELLGDPDASMRADEARAYFARFSNVQTGKVGDITAGLPPHDYLRRPYVEWYSDENGRVVLEYATNRIRVIGLPIPYQESYPISRVKQARNMGEFLRSIEEELAGENGADQDGSS